MGAVWGLLKRAIHPEIWDIGESLPPENEILKEGIKNGSIRRNKELVQNLMPPNATGIPQKTLFGSEYFRGHNRRFAPSLGSVDLVSPSFAKGGFSVAWGGAILPIHQSDMEKWPISRNSLEAGYREVMRRIPLAYSENSELDCQDFPLFAEPEGVLPLSAQAKWVLDRSGRGRQLAGRVQSARLALRVDPLVQKNACVQCGLCLSGCAHDSIYNFSESLKGLPKGIRYRNGIVLTRLNAQDGQIYAHAVDVHGAPVPTEKFDHVLLGAGAISTTRIILESLQLFETDLTLLDSQKFILPGLTTKSFRRNRAAEISLPQLFMDFQDSNGHWNHAQLTCVNDYILTALPSFMAKDKGLMPRVVGPLTSRLMTAWCGLHSDYSSKFQIRLLRAHSSGRPILKTKPYLNPNTPAHIKSAANAFFRLARSAGLWLIPSAKRIGGPGAGCHFGGSLPMSDNPQNAWETNVLGEVHGLPGVHVVDTATFPSIPGTTVGLTTAANAYRIASEISLSS